MLTCYICSCIITKNNTYKEHIILNALGGRLVSPSIICQLCAPKFDAIDTALAEQLNFIGLMLDIKRDRGKNPPIKVTVIETGDVISLDTGGKPVLIKPIIKENPDNGGISITARDKKEMRKILTGLTRKYSFNEEVEALIKKSNKSEEYFDKPVNIHIKLGEEEGFRAICKMIVSFYMQNGGNRQQILHLLPYIMQGTQEKIVWYYYADEVINAKSATFEVVHRLFVKASSNEKLMYGYVELYSTFKFLILMSDDYIGEDFHHSYCFDILNQSQVEPSFNMNLPRDTVLEVVSFRETNLDKFKYVLQKLLLFIDKKQSDDCISNIVQKNLDMAFESLIEGAVPSDEKFQMLIENLSEDFAKFLYSKNKAFQDSQEKNLE
ncbi:HNH endonuclease [Nostoc sp. FACHB-888]|uniref:HNH endonuclease n=1 Tax=Nostoc sp. FACHB-888 TaxID=2692842 RepID=UPI0016852CC6|nr:HNH endonuclease [Nostoc sp. FACHB-888]MBD2247255.1 hypothetical protein [Nostoc sp. FACHB-888]